MRINDLGINKGRPFGLPLLFIPPHAARALRADICAAPCGWEARAQGTHKTRPSDPDGENAPARGKPHTQGRAAA